MAIPQQQNQPVPTRTELEAQLTQLVMQRSQMKDQIEGIEKAMTPLSAMIQLLTAQEAEAHATAEAIKD